MDERAETQEPDGGRGSPPSPPLSATGPVADLGSYSDYSRYIERGGELVKHKKSQNNFPARLHRLLSEQNGNVLVWLVGHPESRRILFP